MFDELASESVSKLDRVKKWLSKPNDPRTLKLFAVTFLLLLVIPTGIWFFTRGSSSSSSRYDPTTVLWTVNSGLAADFNTAGNNAVFGTTAFNNCSGCKDVALTSSSTISTEALTNSSINTLGQSAAKNLLFSFNFYLNGNPTANVPFYYFLTLNKTISSNQLTYNPLNDPNVVFALQFSCISSCSSGTRIYSVVTYLQLRPGDSINSEIPTGVCTSSNSCFQNQQLNNGVGTVDPLSHIVQLQQYLNYTGGTTQNNPCPATSSSFGSGCSTQYVADDQTGFLLATGRLLQPPLLSQPNYYFGIFTSPNFGSQLVTLYDTGTYSTGTNLDPASSGFPVSACPCNVRSMESDLVLLISTPATPPAPTIDGSGFFGPLLKILIPIGVFILQQVVMFFTFIGAVIITALNAIGNFFGLGNLGTDLSSFFSGVSSWFSTVLGGIFANFLSLVNLAGNGLTLFFNFIGSTLWTNLVSFLGLLAPFWGLAVTIWGYLTTLLTSGGIGLNFFFMLDYIYGMFLLSRKGMEGFHQWLNTNETIFIRIWKLGNLAFQFSMTFLVQAKQLIAQWL